MFLVQFLWLVCCTCVSFHSRACGKSVWESDPCKTLHLGDIPGHQRMQIFVSTKSQVHVRQVGRQLICLILNLGLLHWLLVVLVRSAHHYKQCSEVQLLNLVIRCGVGWWTTHVFISYGGFLHILRWLLGTDLWLQGHPFSLVVPEFHVQVGCIRALLLPVERP